MAPEDILPEELLERLRSRAAGYDQENRFFHEDLQDLADAGYLKVFVPEADGGRGLGLEAVAELQRRLATAAPATALAVNMHLVWTGVAHAMSARGDDSLDFVLKDAGQGEIFAFGISEAGNDSMLFDSGTVARPLPDGSYSFTGRKIFTSLSRGWTRLGTFGKDADARNGEGELVFGFLRRDEPGHETLDDWNTLGMRASASNTTLLTDAVIPAERIFRKLPVGPNKDLLIFAIFACFETLLAAVYTGLAERAFALAVDNVKRRVSAKYGGRSFAQDPDIRWKIADAAMAMDGMLPQLSAITRDVDRMVDHGPQWFPKLVGLKSRATENARYVVDLAIRVSGGSSYFRGSELERLYRDVLAGIFHPSNDESAHNTVASAWLGPLEA
ncbi:acyl-CoA/acyl-ACP dehydrogenase [Arthrobacter sp. TES]|uniref:Acyl-CoA/acyl-ACP dehydrogenase n=1 Tax=Paenarthrobacter ureafaciens TaxID=37931 RepID=A0AAX3EPL9_PAEUR|nr:MULTISPECIES: acyl-CoA dehydrogenase family protein [Paenarthrobacter]AOY71378.1 acyl-CoA dehydrogenase [Arthrobacter sp. ZXY-2]ERI39465.1 acyl-CoA dehydrogenase [Arthrobacter sp. AK-YN10]NKR11701.1 acyl-CoA dehydrogenase [Arthrobacter sp. M5]NKR15765.1 acyl-CoA dehydrogenase [Arthrobacter sp. M6]OEH63448.1 acyl-CoA dehydrogenase [Arthrobacter sp. D2]OEH65211.1 acyl-CoA dehydrogenase [Arthrobacter sp. D4]QOI63243.1 acyl-CoA/acyl-ACP dehydrogenase [Arthrobacter sp. TES]